MAGVQGLQKQMVSIPMGAGMDTRDNPVLLDKERFTLIQNAHFTKGPLGQLAPRNGSQVVGPIFGSITTLSMQMLASLGGQEIDVVAGGSLYAYSPAMQTWINRGSVTAHVPSRSQIVRNNYDQSSQDACTLLGVTVYGWADVRGGIWYKVMDQASGAVLQAETQLDAEGAYLRIVSDTTANINLFWTNNAGQVNVATFPVATATAAPTQTTVDSGEKSNSPIDAIYVPSIPAFGLLWLQPSGHPVVQTVNPTTFASVNTRALQTVVCTQVAIGLCGGGDIFCASYSGVTASGTTYFDYSVASSLASVASYNAAGKTGTTLGVATLATGTTAMVLQTAATNGIPIIRQYTLTSAGISLNNYTLSVGTSLVSAPFLQGGANYVLVANTSTVQPTYFLLPIQVTPILGSQVQEPVGRYVSLNAGAVPAVGLTHASQTAAGVWLLGILVNAELESEGGKPVIVTGIDALVLDFTQTAIQAGQLGRDMQLSGGLPQLYDSEVICENGFNLFPEAPTLGLLTSMLGLAVTTDGTAATAQSFTITIPENQVTQGHDGILLANSSKVIGIPEYITIGTTELFWFDIQGQTAAPTTTGSFTPNAVLIGATWSASLIANALGQASTGIINQVFGGTGFTSTVTGNVVTVTATAAGAQPRPQTFSQFNVNQTVKGTGLTQAIFDVNCIPGKLIGPGQYFTFDVNPAGTDIQYYAWFSVNNVGTDPAPVGLPSNPVHISVLSTDSETQVAAKLVTQLNAAAIGVTASQIDGPIVQVQSTANGLSFFAPTIGTMGAGLGTVGAVASNQWDSYTYSLMFENVDEVGQLGRSAPAISTQIMIPAYGYGNAQVQVTLTNQSLLTSRASVDVVIYRTLTLGSLLYRTSSATSLLVASGSTWTSNFQDQTPDATLQFNELCYSQPLLPNQVIPNNCPPAYTQIANFQDQQWINDCEDSSLMWFSKSFVSGVQVEWSNEQTLRFDPSYGSVVAALAMDSDLIVFTTLGIWAVSGAGPDSTGAGTPFSLTLVSAACGCRDPQSAVLTPNGIIFKSQKGFALLDRGLQVHMDFGDPVVAYLADVVTNATVVATMSEVRFLSGVSGTPLVYDYGFSQWATSAGNAGINAIEWQGQYLQNIGGDAFIVEEDPGFYSDGVTGSEFTYLVKTAWLKPSAIQGFGRIWWIYFQGNFPTGGPGIQVQIAYDYNPAIVDTFTIVPVNPRQFRVFPSRTACESLQITIQDTGSLSDSNKLALNSIDLEVGVRRGGYKKLGPTAST